MKKFFSLLVLAALLLAVIIGVPPCESAITTIGVMNSGNIACALIVAIVIIVCVLLLQTKYKAQAARLLLYLVVTAEREFGSGTGQLKYSAVATWLYEKLPSLAQFILTANTINNLIESAVSEMKEYFEATAQVKGLAEIEQASTTKASNTEEIE